MEAVWLWAEPLLNQRMSEDIAGQFAEHAYVEQVGAANMSTGARLAEESSGGGNSTGRLVGITALRSEVNGLSRHQPLTRASYPNPFAMPLAITGISRTNHTIRRGQPFLDMRFTLT